MMHNSRKLTIVGFCYIFLIALVLTACAAPVPAPVISATPSPDVVLIPFRTATPSPTFTPVLDLSPVPLTPAPTATPFTHKVARGETMLGIAIQYGIKLEDLLAANPTVDPRMMSVDTLLVVPLPGITGDPTPTATPLPLALAVPACYRAAGDGLYCITELTNPLDQAVESLSAWVGLIHAGETIASQVVVPGLNLLRSGERIPLLAFFPGPIDADASPRVELLTALQVSDADPRYLDALFSLQKMEISPDGLQAQVIGNVSWSEDQTIPQTIWLVFIAYDAGDRPVGVRKVETQPACPADNAASCSSLAVEGIVYSLGPAIQRVEVLVEARP